MSYADQCCLEKGKSITSHFPKNLLLLFLAKQHSWLDTNIWKLSKPLPGLSMWGCWSAVDAGDHSGNGVTPQYKPVLLAPVTVS